MNILIKHNKSKRHLFEATDDKTPTSSLIAQINAIDLNSPRDGGGGGGEDDDDWDPNGVVRRMIGTSMLKEILAWQKMLVCFNSAFMFQIETSTLSTHLRY